MKVLKKTSKATYEGNLVGGHYHILYLNSDDGLGATSFDDGHMHEVQYVPAQEAQYDEQGQEIAPASPGGFVIAPAEDGHTHSQEDYVIKPSKNKESKEKVIADVYHLFKDWKELECKSIERGRESDGFYCGDGQWDNWQKQELESLKRACVTINLTGRYIDELKGAQMQQRTDFDFAPVEGGDQAAADLMKITTKNLLDQCFYQREKSKIFHDQVVPGRGLINCYISFEKDLRGEVVVERFPWDQAVFGPHEKEDLSDCEGLIKHRMYSMPKLQQLWGDKADEIEKDFQSFDAIRNDHVTYADDQYAKSDNKYMAPMSIGDDAIVDIAKKEYRVLECWRKKYVSIPVLANVDDDFYFNAFGWNKKDIDAAKTIPGFYLVRKPSVKIRITKIAGNVVLSDEDPADLPYDDFFLIPVYAYKHKNKFWGKVESVKDAQREINYRRSQSIDIGNKMIAYGYFVNEETFADSQELEKFKRNSTSPGGVYKLGLGQEPPARIEGAKFPGEIVELMRLGTEDLATLINITTESVGANESGAKFMQRQKSKMTANEFLFDNMSFAEQKLGRLLISLIQRYYTPERIARLVNHVSQKTSVEIAGKPLEEFTEQEIIETLENADLTKLDVVIAESSYSPTIRLATFSLLSDLGSKGMMIPPEILVEFAPIPDEQKKKILESLAQQQATAGQAEQDKSKAEVAKTLFANNIYPPEMLQQFGIDPNSVPGSTPPPPPDSQQEPTAPLNVQTNGAYPAEFP